MYRNDSNHWHLQQCSLRMRANGYPFYFRQSKKTCQTMWGSPRTSSNSKEWWFSDIKNAYWHYVYSRKASKKPPSRQHQLRLQSMHLTHVTIAKGEVISVLNASRSSVRYYSGAWNKQAIMVRHSVWSKTDTCVKIYFILPLKHYQVFYEFCPVNFDLLVSTLWYDMILCLTKLENAWTNTNFGRKVSNVRPLFQALLQ